MPAFSGGGGDREYDVGALGHGGDPLLEADHEAGLVEGGQEGGRVGGVVGVDAGDHEGVEAGADDGFGVETALTGQQVCLDRTPVAGTTRHPGEPGAGAIGELGSGGVGAGAGRQPLADQDHRSLGDPADLRQRVVLGTRSSQDDLGSELARALRGVRTQGGDPQTVLVGLAQPEEERSGLVLGLEAGQHDVVGGVEVGVGEAGPRDA